MGTLSDWAPQIVVIEKVEQHPDADTLDIATVLGDYPVIVKRGEYKMGDEAGYIPIDSIVPDTEQFYFLCPKLYEKYEENGEVKSRHIGSKYPLGLVPEKSRIIRAKKIRGIYSQGMLVSLYSFLGWSSEKLPVGFSIVDLIPLTKWNEPEEENLPNFHSADVESPPKGWHIPHYDIDGIRRYLSCLLPNEEIVLTEKLHGSNAAFSHDGTRLWSKSRNLYKKMDPEDMWWDIAIRYDLKNKLKNYPGLVFFGEIHGQVSGFRYDSVVEGGQLLTRIRFFDVWDTKTMRYLDYDPMMVILKEAGLDPVPELYRGKWLGKDAMYPYAEGMTTIGGKHIREGWVLRPVQGRYEPRLDSRMIVKLVGEGYNLQK
jgi:RNA ligase (TIGR02306 family)